MTPSKVVEYFCSFIILKIQILIINDIRSFFKMKSTWFVVCAIFLLGLTLRSIDLGTGFTYDEAFWLIRSPNFIDAVLTHNWIDTYQVPHPGVITMWLSGVILKLIPVSDFPLKLSIARSPIVLVTSVSILLIFYLVKLLFNTKIALLSATLIALDPVLIAYSRLIHLDAMLSTLMILSVLTFIAFLNHSKIWFLALSGILAGLAVLAKMPAIFLILFIPFISLILIEDKVHSKRYIFIFYFLCITTFFLLWPAMWVDPIHTIAKMVLDQGSGLEKVLTSPHGSGFFLGEANKGDNGPLFYPVSFLLMVTPLTLLFFLICMGVFAKEYIDKGFTNSNKSILILLLYILLFAIQMSLASKTVARYLLPIFPAIDILAGIGLYSTFKNYFNKRFVFYSLLAIVMVIQMSLSVPIAPYFLSYSNPVVFGGPSHVTELFLKGLGEGNDLAAKYLNDKPNSKNLTVIAQYPGFREYFHGKTIPLWEMENDNISSFDADYMVFYVSTVQRKINENLWSMYKNQTPEKIISINGINYCWIYRLNSTKAA